MTPSLAPADYSAAMQSADTIAQQAMPQQQAPPDESQLELQKASSVFTPVMDYIDSSGVTGAAADNLRQAIAAFINEAMASKTPAPQTASPQY